MFLSGEVILTKMRIAGIMLTTETRKYYKLRMRSMNIKQIPDDLMQAFKRWCGFHGLTVRADVLHFMKIAAKELGELDKQYQKSFPGHPLGKEKPDQ